MKLRNFALSAVALAVLALTSFAQVTTIEGDVKGTDGKPVQNAEILIHRTDIKWDSKTKTDKKGHYIHTGVPLGTYEITLQIEGKVADKVNGVKTSLGGTPPVNFDLRQAAAASANNAARQAEIQKAYETGQMSDELKRSMTPEQRAQMEKDIAASGAKIKKQKDLNDNFNVGKTALDCANNPDCLKQQIASAAAPGGGTVQITPEQLTAQKASQFQTAVTGLEKASEVDPTQPAVWANLGDAYVGLAGMKTGPEFDQLAQKGIDAYAKSIELKPDDAAAHNNYALALAKVHKYPEMEAELKKAAELDPATAYVKFFNLGALLSNAGQAEAAGKAFKMAIDAAPEEKKNAGAYYQYGMSLAAQASASPDGKITFPPGTVEAFQKYLQLAPDGKDAASAQDMIKTLGGTIETNFKNPAAAKDTTKKKK